MSKLTAVTWLENHFKKLQSKGEKMTWHQIIEITKLAKEPEKEQIETAWIAGREFGCKFDDPETAEQYYTQNFKTD